MVEGAQATGKHSFEAVVGLAKSPGGWKMRCPHPPVLQAGATSSSGPGELSFGTRESLIFRFWEQPGQIKRPPAGP